MKILHVIFAFEYGGAETMLVDIVNEQVKTDDISLLVINKEYDEGLLNTIDKRVNIRLLNRKSGSRNPLDIIRLQKLIFELSPDVIHSHDSIMIRMFPFHRYYKTILTVHDVGLSLDGVHLYDHVVAISSAVKNDLMNRNVRNVSVVFNGIDISRIEMKQNEKGIASPNSIFRIVQVSRLDHQKKGQHILLDAIRYLKDELNITNVHVDFIGEGSSRSFLCDLIDKYGIAGQVSFLGLRDRAYIYSHLKDYDLLLQPSIFEGFGLTVTEGMAAKIPVLVSDGDGPVEVIQQGKYGYYFETGNAIGCATQINRIIQSGNNVADMVDKAYDYCLDNFDIKKTVREYRYAYEKLLGKQVYFSV